MASTGTKALIAGGTALLLCLVGGVLYAFGLSPFGEEKGEIKASEVCRTLGASDGSAVALRRVLPGESAYSFDDAVSDPRRDDMDVSYSSSCFVDGGGKQLLSATAEMLQYDHAEEWVEEVVGQFASVSSLKAFDAGDKAVASDKVAAVYLPCVARGDGQHLSVVVHLKQQGGGGAERLRDGLVSLARSTARFAQQNAKCDVVAEVGT
ncbi:hypothetical protein NX794_32895 [Streptomyces sp. LP11]|uniref:Secreted protein n=1 Tax=Streptomyces pyxinicus TaxID=2970331 RepID=A0ABT2BBT1_9ACTN|nr:hypothetical protein [Streptomyces sp. LP11]MCS0605969.1 hypothetical protein [Streptomyces sp. LP11]